jgi:hypothetical protein
MNTFAAVMLIVWVVGWILAMVRAGWQARMGGSAGIAVGQLPPVSGSRGK